MSLFECQGQGRAIRQLQVAHAAGRLGQSMIFHGPAGVGKGLLARQWAKLLLCAQPVERRSREDQDGAREAAGGPGEAGAAGQGGAGEATGGGGRVMQDCCDACAECRLVEAGTHPDLQVVNRETARYASGSRERQLIALPIDVIREFVIRPAGMHPARGRARVFIIEQAEAMNRAAQNALLKTLEEPPARTFLILVSTNPGLFLPTVRSRCQAVRFRALGREFVRGRLAAAGAGPAEAGYWADMSGGRLGVALEWMGLELYDTVGALRERLGGLGYESVLETAGWLVEQGKEYWRKHRQLHPEAGPSQALREGYRFLLEVMGHSFGQGLRAGAGLEAGEKEAAGIAAAAGATAEAGAVRRLSDRFGVWGCSRAIRATREAERLLEANVNPTLIFESLLLNLLNCAGAAGPITRRVG